MFELSITRGRTEDWTGTILDANGDGVTLDPSDIVRFKVGRGNAATPLLDLDDAATLAGSVVTVSQTNPGEYNVRFAQDDTSDLAPGDYDAEAILIDTGDGNCAKQINFGIVHVLASMGGDVGL